MIGLPSKYLLFHGSIVLFTGLLSGILMGSAINKKKGEEAVRAWRVAHSGLIMDGLMMLIIALIVPYLKVGEVAVWTLVWGLVISGYGFVMALPLGAWKGYRGLVPKPHGINTIVYAGNVIGVVGSLVGTAIVIFGCLRALY